MYAVDRLRDRKFNGYRRLAIPHDLDQVANKAVTEYVNADDITRRAILDALTARGADVLSVYGERLAAVAVRSQSDSILHTAATAAGMAHIRMEDIRNNLIVLAALDHSAELLGTTLDLIVDQIAVLLPPPALITFRKFAARDPRNRSLTAMGLVTRGEGPTFRYW